MHPDRYRENYYVFNVEYKVAAAGIIRECTHATNKENSARLSLFCFLQFARAFVTLMRLMYELSFVQRWELKFKVYKNDQFDCIET